MKHLTDLAILIAAYAILIAAAGCASSPQQSTATVTPGRSEASKVVLDSSPAETIIEFEGIRLIKRGPTTRSTYESAVGIGAGATATGDKLSDKVTGTPPNASLPDGGQATGGGIKTDTTATAMVLPPLPWKNPLFTIGILLAFAAGFCIYKKLDFHAAALLGAGAIACEAMAFFPWLLLWACAGMVLTFGGMFAWKAYQAHRQTEANRATQAGIAGLPTGTKQQVESAIAGHTEPPDVAVISAIKARDEL